MQSIRTNAWANRYNWHVSLRRFYGTKVEVFNLADIGEGIAEVEILQWFVKPGDKIEEFDKICEVQSDKATVEIKSPFAGVVKRLYYEVGLHNGFVKPTNLFNIPPLITGWINGQSAHTSDGCGSGIGWCQ